MLGVKEKAGAEQLAAEQQRHLKAVRDLRSQIWKNDELDELERLVLGLTGSQEQLEHYKQLAAKVAANIGQPVVRIERMKDEAGGADSAVGGIITGGVTFTSSFRHESPLERGSGHVKLSVPVTARVYGRDSWREGMLINTHDDSGSHVEVAHLINAEWSNSTSDPKNDYYESLAHPVLIGREEIYESELFTGLVKKLVLDIEATKV